ncbi:hypothetical protein D9M69_505090 [compost metagenome]
MGVEPVVVMLCTSAFKCCLTVALLAIRLPLATLNTRRTLSVGDVSKLRSLRSLSTVGAINRLSALPGAQFPRLKMLCNSVAMLAFVHVKVWPAVQPPALLSIRHELPVVLFRPLRLLALVVNCDELLAVSKEIVVLVLGSFAVSWGVSRTFALSTVAP